MEGGIFQSDLRGKGRKTCVFAYVCTCIHLYIVYIYIYIYIYDTNNKTQLYRMFHWNNIFLSISG